MTLFEPLFWYQRHLSITLFCFLFDVNLKTCLSTQQNIPHNRFHLLESRFPWLPSPGKPGSRHPAQHLPQRRCGGQTCYLCPGSPANVPSLVANAVVTWSLQAKHEWFCQEFADLHIDPGVILGAGTWGSLQGSYLDMQVTTNNLGSWSKADFPSAKNRLKSGISNDFSSTVAGSCLAESALGSQPSTITTCLQEKTIPTDQNNNTNSTLFLYLYLLHCKGNLVPSVFGSPLPGY